MIFVSKKQTAISNRFIKLEKQQDSDFRTSTKSRLLRIIELRARDERVLTPPTHITVFYIVKTTMTTQLTD